MATRSRSKQEPVEPTETCKQCRFALFLKESIECRRNPPQVIYEGSTGFVEHRFPEVEVTLWCGEFRPKLTS
ncbi:hypothetical protein LMG22037_06607 [Paraburkholderia phenoliruptrix]|uniref:Uncharacterized protein n=1 Tax=Paraburkholderia phenoliruptrix TaxID=252970 RepID=A0A6J5CPI3_9BURK|nr:hypothetical protein LMG22037_06607 [Paraburkholderia phenoliruptrix]